MWHSIIKEVLNILIRKIEFEQYTFEIIVTILAKQI